MRLRFVRPAILPVLLSIFLLPGTLWAQDQGTIQGTVTAAESGEPMAGAAVSAVGTARGVFTGPDGNYTLEIGPGTYTIRASFIGYTIPEERVTVVAGETITVDFQLEIGGLVAEPIVAIGSRTERTTIETPVPIDVVPAEIIRETPQLELNQILTLLVPSYNASNQTIGDGSDHINPASLRGLGPDQTLVLINGKRRHTNALTHVNGTFGRGTVGVDMNAIPTVAIQQVEVLRDGAAAQYGSDAIAGVVNVVLRSPTEEDGLQLNMVAGGNLAEGDGEQVMVDGSYGFRIGQRGHFSVFGQYLDRNRTNRSGNWTGDIFPGISGTAETNAELQRRGLTRADFSMKTGQSDARVGWGWFDAAVPISADAEVYAFGGLSVRDGRATGFFRLPDSEARVVPEIYPNGFLPQIASGINDGSVSGGVRGRLGGWDVELSGTFGGNAFQWNIENTNNASLGTASPITFDAGRLAFKQAVGNLDVVRLLDTGGKLKYLSLVFGSEFRAENYQIQDGEFGSWSLGNGGDVPGVDFDTTSTGSPKAAGSQVFPGFQPSNRVNRNRNSIAGYLGFESEITDRFLLDIGGRLENYSDFGTAVTGKLAMRYRIGEAFYLRGAISNGFRAPSLNQIWFNNISTQFVFDSGGNLVPEQVLTANNQSTVTKAFGIPDLDKETSLNASAGFTTQPLDNFSVAVDGYYITIDNRIVLTSRFTDSNPAVAAILAPFSSLGVSQVQFFSNVIDTKTYGIDIVLNWATRFNNAGVLNLFGSANFGKTELRKVNVPQSLRGVIGNDCANLDDLTSCTLFNREEQNRVETALPRQKFNLGARYNQGRFSGLLAMAYFGKIYYRPNDSSLDEEFSARAILDLGLGFELWRGVSISAGANNLLNTFPGEQQLDANRSGERFIYSRRVTQYGMNGGFYYAGLSFNLH